VSAGSLARGQQAPDPAAQQPGVEVLTRGPVHEAFAEPAIRAPRPTPVIPKQAPKDIEELPPDQKPEGDNVQWIPGYWAWDDDSNDFLWVSGVWRAVPPGKHWVPGYWNQVDGGWQWVAGFWSDVQTNQIEFLPQPPDPIDEAIPPHAADDGIYQPGSWVYVDGRYLWRPGFWVTYREGWVWNPAHYVWSPGGFIFVDGYWDYAVENRGLLFAPVYVAPAFRTQPSFVYRPLLVVLDTFLLTALFERPYYAHYYFGDYYDARYSRLGFVPWTEARFGRYVEDPLFTYYRRQHHDNPNWARETRDLYTMRRTNPTARPPRTLVQQQQIVQNIQNRTVNVTNINQVTAVTPITRVDNNVKRLQAVPQPQHQEFRKTATQFRSFSADRAKVEAQAAQRVQPRVQAGQLQPPHRVEMPKSRPAPMRQPEGAKGVTPPARPVMPEARNVHPTTGQPIEPLRTKPGQPPHEGAAHPNPMPPAQPPAKPPAGTPHPEAQKQPPPKPPGNPPAKPPEKDKDKEKKGKDKDGEKKGDKG
jgi:hypothetical protein